MFPESGLVYDYQLDDAGISLPALDDDEEDELKTREVRYTNAYFMLKI